MEKKKVASVDEYMQQFDGPALQQLKDLRKLIKTNFPGATECISYNIPAYILDTKPLVYFAGYKQHVGLYALPNTHKAFAKQLIVYKQGKGSVQFPLSQPLPVRLIIEMIQHNQKKIELDLK